VSVSIEQLQAESDAAGQGLRLVLLGTSVLVVSHAGDSHDGELLPAPPALVTLIAGRPVVAAIRYTAATSLGARVRTTGTVPGELYRLTLPLQTGASLDGRLLAVDAVSGAVRKIVFTATFKRLNAGALLVGAITQLASHADTAATSWTIAVSVSGNDLVVTVTGAASRTIDWLLTGSVDFFGPGGLA
jgi:hypothetical protein